MPDGVPTLVFNFLRNSMIVSCKGRWAGHPQKFANSTGFRKIGPTISLKAAGLLEASTVDSTGVFELQLSLRFHLVQLICMQCVCGF
jgi:hypothetical protein